ncbi:hypothetical protein GCM10028895_04940 [Pontibacter rugosus]
MVKQAEKHQFISVEPSPLVANGQQVTFDLKAQVPEKLVREKEVYKLDIYYLYGDEKRENIATYNFDFGNFLYENHTPTITRQLSFPYEPAKTTGRLMVQGKAVDKEDGDMAYTKPKQVAIGLNTTPLLLVRNNKFTFATDEFKESVDQPTSLMFYFQENKADLDHYIGSNLPTLDQYVLDNVPTQKIKIIGYQSPDEKGANIAAKRAKELETYYQKQLKTLDYSGKKVTISTEVHNNGLDALKEKVKASALPKLQIQQVLTILSSEGNMNEKQRSNKQRLSIIYRSTSTQVCGPLKYRLTITAAVSLTMSCMCWQSKLQQKKRMLML